MLNFSPKIRLGMLINVMLIKNKHVSRKIAEAVEKSKTWPEIFRHANLSLSKFKTITKVKIVFKKVINLPKIIKSMFHANFFVIFGISGFQYLQNFLFEFFFCFLSFLLLLSKWKCKIP